MKRKDAFRKLRTICQRLDELDPADFDLYPLRLYLFGSVLTDKPDPKNIDLVFIYQEPPGYDRANLYYDTVASRPVHYERAIIHLRKGMKRVNVSVGRDSLEGWMERVLLLEAPMRPIWEPGANWAAVLDDIEASPRAWLGPRTPASLEQFRVRIKSQPYDDVLAELAPILAGIEAQQLPAKED